MLSWWKKGPHDHIGDEEFSQWCVQSTTLICAYFHVCLSGLVGNLKTCSPPMYRFYLVLKNRSSGEPITQEELDIASGQKVLEPGKASKFVEELESKTENIRTAFKKQAEQELVCHTSLFLYCLFMRPTFI